MATAPNRSSRSALPDLTDMILRLERYWINQPSKLQPDHKQHGCRVLAHPEGEKGDYCDVYFTGSDTISSRMAKSSLSLGWPPMSRHIDKEPSRAGSRRMLATHFVRFYSGGWYMAQEFPGEGWLLEDGKADLDLVVESHKLAKPVKRKMKYP